MRQVYKIADKIIEINSIYERVHEYCKDYLVPDETCDFSVNITPEDIVYERKRNEKTAESEGRESYYYPDEYLEELAVYRKIAEKMPDYDTFLFHGSSIAVDNEAYLFTAVSGTGKSTHARLWKEYLGERAVMINDDKPLLRVDDEGVTVFGTPYNGKHRLGSNIAVPLKAICILTRDKTNHIEKITKKQAYATLLQQTYRPADPLQLAKTMTLLDGLSDRVKLYLLGCNMDIEAAKISYEGMK